jgi:TnpA family transposase
MKAGLSVEADTVYSDTQGQSASVFAFTYLMGIQLMPRIRNWKDLTFFRPDRKSKYRNIDQLFGEAIQWDLIEAGQPELMQVVISFQAGHLASPTLLRKLSYGGARNHLFAAAHEVGRAVRTIFLLKWISKLERRQEVTANTNKIESYNGFAKWFSFGGDVIPENDPVEQQKRLRYNDLVAACVILQNTVDMMRTLEELTAEGQGVDMADVRFLSPYATSHVKRFGDYALDLGKPPESWLSEATFREALNQSRQKPDARARL